DNAPAGTPAKIGINRDVGPSRFQRCALTEADEKLWSRFRSRSWSGCGCRSGRYGESAIHRRWTIHLRETGGIFQIDQSRPTRDGSAPCVLRIQHELEVNHRRLSGAREVQFFYLRRRYRVSDAAGVAIFVYLDHRSDGH